MNNLKLKINKNEINESTYHTPIFDIKIDNNTDIIRLHAPSWVNVAVYNNTYKEWNLVKELRHGINEEVIEFMSGTIEENESPKEAALREMREELGYDIDNLVEIKSLYEENVNPAFMDNKIYGFYIKVEGEPKEQHLDKNEKVSIFKSDVIRFKNNGLISRHTLSSLDEHHINFSYDPFR